MSEETPPVGEQTPPVGETTPPAGGEVGFEAKYKAEVINSQKLRLRAQTAETTIEEATAQAKTDEEAKLAEQGKFKELHEKLALENEALTTENANYAEKIKVIQEAEDKEREDLIGKLPEEKRVLYDGVTLANLRTIVADVTGSPQIGVNGDRPSGVAGEPIVYRNDMTPAEKQEWMDQKVKVAQERT